MYLTRFGAPSGGKVEHGGAPPFAPPQSPWDPFRSRVYILLGMSGPAYLGSEWAPNWFQM